MKKIVYLIPLLAVMAIASCQNKDGIKPKDGVVIEADEAFAALDLTMENMEKQTAVEAYVRSLAIDSDIDQFKIVEGDKLQQSVDMNIKTSEGVLDLAVVSLNKEKENADAQASISLNTKITANGTVENKEGVQKEIHSNGKMVSNVYISEGKTYINISKETKPFVESIAASLDEKLPTLLWPLRYRLDTAVSFKDFSFQFDAEEELEKFNELSEEERNDFVFQKYSKTSFSIYTKHTTTEEEKDGEYLLEKQITNYEVTLEFDINEGLQRVAFIINEDTSKTVYSEIYQDEGFNAANYNKAFLSSNISKEVVKAAGKASFNYGSDVDFSLPKDLPIYIPIPLGELPNVVPTEQ